MQKKGENVGRMGDTGRPAFLLKRMLYEIYNGA